MITSSELIKRLREAFGDGMELPIAFWRSNEPISLTERIGGCMFKEIVKVKEGVPLSLSGDTIGCLGGKFYLGFSEKLADIVPGFIAHKECYKRSPELVWQFAEGVGVVKSEQQYINLQRIDQMESLDGIEGLMFFARPDVISGLCTWAFYDNNNRDAVRSEFGSGCSMMFASTMRENREGGQSCFLGMFDPTMRPLLGANELGFSIPASRLVTMVETMGDCFLSKGFAWKKIRARISGE